MALSTEALEELAHRIRAWAFARERARINDGKPPLVARADASPLADAYLKARAIDAALGTWLAETVMLADLDMPVGVWLARWKKAPIEIRGEGPIDVREFAALLAWEPITERRAMLSRLGDQRVGHHLDEARGVVDAFRGLAPRLGLSGSEEVTTAIGWGEPAAIARAAESVLSATDDVFRVADDWVRGRVGLPRSVELSWPDRLRTRALLRTTELIPSGDRTGIASRWLVRSGLEAPLGRVRDATRAATLSGAGVSVIVDDPGARSTLVGTPSRTAHGAVSLTAAMCEATLANTANEPRLALRAGVDRVHLAVANLLGRRLFLEAKFLDREAAIDRGTNEVALLELLYQELFATRLEAAQGLFALEVMNRVSDLPARFRQFMFRALGSSPEPGWASQEASVWLRTRPGAQTVALLLETRLHASLRDRFDEDWYRNPRSGEALRARFGDMHTTGTLASFASEAAVEDPLTLLTRDALAARMTDAFHNATGR